MARSPFDVSDILLQGGNMGQLLGRGIEQAASGLAGGIERYAQIKDRNKQLQGTVDSTSKFLEAASKMEGLPAGLKAFATNLGTQLHDPNVPLSQKASLAQQASQNIGQYMQLGQAAVQEQERIKQAQVMQKLQMMNQFPGGGAGVLNPQAMQQVAANRANPMMAAASQLYGATGQVASPAVLADYAAKVEAINAKPAQGQLVSNEQFNAWKQQGLDVKAVPNPKGGWLVKEVGTYAPKADTNVSVNAGESAYRKTLGEDAAKVQMELYKSAKNATKTLPKLNETMQLLEKGDVSTGAFAEIEKNVNRLRAKFMNDTKAGKAVTDTEVLDAMLGSDVFPMIGDLGIGARGLDTPAEREFLRSVMTGSIPLNKETLKRLTETRRNIQLRAINEYNAQVDSGELNDFFEATKFRKKKFEIPGEQSSQPSQSSVITVDY